MARKTAEEAAKTRSAVIDAALETFAERGYAAAQLEDIAARAELTRGAVYHHFDDKAALFLTVLRERWHSVMEPVLARLDADGDADKRLRAFVEAFVAALDHDAQARALLRMSMSGDVRLPAFSTHLPEKLDVFASWRSRIADVIADAPASRPRRGRVDSRNDARAQALVLGLIGYSVWSNLAPPGGPRGRAQRPAEREALVTALLRTVS